MSLLKVEDMHVYYGNIHAIKGVSFEVNEGEIVTLIGANGAGKSTTLNTVAGLLKPRSGQVTFNGQNIVGMPASKVVSLGMALCPEGRRVFQQMTVRENLEMGGFTRPAGEIAGSLDHVFKLFPRLKEREKQVAGTLSGGEQQMLAVGRAMMARPKLMMMDEPSLGLAPLVVRDIFHIIRQLSQEGITILLIEQNANAALKCASYGFVLETGVITMEGKGLELLEDPRVRDAYLGEAKHKK